MFRRATQIPLTERVFIPSTIPSPAPGNPPITLRGIEDGDWVDFDLDDTSIRQQRIMGAAMTAIGTPGGNVTLRADPFMHRLATLKEVIFGWGGTAGEEEFSPEMVDDLPPEVSKYLYDQWAGLTKPRSESEKNALSGASQRGRPPARGSRQSSGISTRSELPETSD